MGSCCVTQGAQPCTLWWPRGVGSGWGWEGEPQVGGDIYTYTHVCISLLNIITDSHCYMAENTAL